MSPILAITSFGGGVALLGSADTQQTDELRQADGYSIGDRGQLVAASDLTAFPASLSVSGTPVSPLYALSPVQVPQGSFLVGAGDFSGSTFIVTQQMDGSSSGSTSAALVLAGGSAATFVQFPYVGTDGKQKRVVLIALGARPGQDPRSAGGLFALVFDPAGPTYALNNIGQYDALGTGALGEFLGGTHAHQLYPRGITVYNNFVFLWGFDNHETLTGDAPNKMLFSNIGNPLKYGNDPLAAAVAGDPSLEVDRAFQDTDGFTIGGVGESIRAGYVWAGKLWVGTDRGLHYVEGFGRESFLTNGALPVAESLNVVGPRCLVEGPDRLLHGVSDEGHWIFDGGATKPAARRAHLFGAQSPGYFDLIWADPSRGTGFPGKTNQDLVWMLSVPDDREVWIGIPYCSIAAGYGFGADTVIIKYNVDTGGYTRQLFPGRILTNAEIYRRDYTAVEQILLAAPGSTPNVQRYKYKASNGATPVMIATLPVAETVEYAPHGPMGTGVNDTVYLTLSWEAGALPLKFTMTPSVDQEDVFPAVPITIGATAPVSPINGELWMDTSGSDTNLGNGTAGAFTPSHPNDYILRRWITTWAKWIYTARGGQQGTRVTVPIAYTPTKGTRVKIHLACNAASGRYQIESLGLDPSTIRSGL